MSKKSNEKAKKKEINRSQVMYYILMIVAYLYLGFACMYKYIKYESLDRCVLELMLILTLSLVIEYVHIIKNNGKDIRKDLSKNKSAEARLKQYMRESLLVSVVLTTIIFLLIASNRMYINFYDFSLGLYGNIALIIVILTILCFIDFFIIVFVGNYFISEKIIKANNNNTNKTKNRKKKSPRK